MIIIIPISDFSAELFPHIQNNKELLRKELTNFYSIGSVLPVIKIENDFVVIEVDIENIENEQNKYEVLIDKCQKGQFEIALPLAKELIESYPSYLEF
jgi:hypothetical protein